MRRSFLVFAIMGCAASSDGAASGGDLDSFDDDDLPAGSCRDTETDTDPCDTEGTTVGAATAPGDQEPVADACEASEDCMGGVCAAPFDPDTLERGAQQCQFACIPLLDDTLWCSDAASCCNDAAICTGRGYCIVPDDGADTE